MQEEHLRLAEDPRYQELLHRRGRVTGVLTVIMLIAYFGFVLLIAFDKSFLAQPVAGGVTSLGIVLGFALILLAIALTGVYVRAANRVFDPLVDALKAEAGR
ncbi:DUF485 domain-containing protein [Sphingomonas morindae]|uniref:DUF485 domain-containing protein n=1 Tax=Sphingomonas morindae TaxID=1541170 RepID=A0ABY4XC65_9SPHN|nr:DUF485 domain-containing protein [Sphingomonas morindae]USI74419.1 DUF485 domain-containing protein [Sphingomonas morindae]